MTDPTSELQTSLNALNERLTALEERLDGGAKPSLPPGDFWALEALEERAPNSVLVTGSVITPDAKDARWQIGLDTESIFDRDWNSAASPLSALGHPVRLALLRQIMNGVTSTAELVATEGLGTTGQLHHHIRALVSAGWVHSTARGNYAIPAVRVVPLLAILTLTTT